MDPDKINKAIAVFIGWRPAGKLWLSPQGVPHNSYPNFRKDQREMRFAKMNLRKTVDAWKPGGLSLYGSELAKLTSLPIMATTEMQAEAFVRSIEKWEDES